MKINCDIETIGLTVLVHAIAKIDSRYECVSRSNDKNRHG